MKDLLSALCLVAVLEGLFLFATPLAWKRMASQMLELPTSSLRKMGALVLIAGLVVLWWSRH
ncbi:DUF2065 family protein [Stenotrophomonas sp. Iso1]|uniref:DUF2065 domain-containing protein n=1 Tax=Stenotrophomonas sp. Iso1 TaxID=2977283 RepID=UPI0022B7761F|nr:DUF2065 family protein [Stenotrophomonas sp. Iso1]